MIREIDSSSITNMVSKLCIDANIYISDDIKDALEAARSIESSPEGRAVLDDLTENIRIAGSERMAVCQDTGMAVVFLEIGQDVHVSGDIMSIAVNRGVANGYREGYLRASVVNDPLLRINTNDNTPAILYTDIIPGDKIRITVAPKGFGSENMSAVRMLKPSDGVEAIKSFVFDTVINAGANPCPPIILGIGIGGTMDKAAMIAKRALLRPVGLNNELVHIAALEKELLDMINRSGIGPGGLGGRCTALAVNIDTYPTHIAGMPIAVNVGCHATRHASGEI